MSAEGEYEEGFNLAKDTDADDHIGEPNYQDLLCPHCYALIIPMGNATKIRKDVYLPEDEKSHIMWSLESMSQFNSIMVHSRTTMLKYLMCLKCSTEIIGFQVIKHPNEIYIACGRMELAREA